MKQNKTNNRRKKQLKIDPFDPFKDWVFPEIVDKTKPKIKKSRKSKKPRKSKPILNKVAFETKKDTVTFIYKTINKDRKPGKPIVTKKQIQEEIKKIKKGKNGISQLKAFKKVEKLLLGTNLSNKDIKQIKSSVSQSAHFKSRLKQITQGWEHANNPIYRKNLEYIFKISKQAELNEFDILRNSKIFVDANGRTYTPKQLTNITKDFVERMRNLAVSLNHEYLKYWANSRYFKKNLELIKKRFYNENFDIGKFDIDLSKLDFRQPNKLLEKQIDQTRAKYYNKEGLTDGEPTRYFIIEVEYIDSENKIVTGIKIKNEHALESLIQSLKSGPHIETWRKIQNDLAPYGGLSGAFFGVLKNDYDESWQAMGDYFELVKTDMENVVNTIKSAYTNSKGN